MPVRSYIFFLLGNVVDISRNILESHILQTITVFMPVSSMIATG
jgi:hypothetical protein